MKKTPSFMILLIFLSLQCIAQEVSPRIRELGISLSGTSSLGIRYKCGNEKIMMRLTLVTISGNKSNILPDSLGHESSTTGFGFNIGFEKRKSISEKLGCYYGLDLLTSYHTNTSSNQNQSNSYKNESWNLTPGLGFVLGMSYELNEKFFVSAELVPSISYSYGKSTFSTTPSSKTEHTSTSFNYQLGSSGANLTLAYRF